MKITLKFLLAIFVVTNVAFANRMGMLESWANLNDN